MSANPNERTPLFTSGQAAAGPSNPYNQAAQPFLAPLGSPAPPGLQQHTSPGSAHGPTFSAALYRVDPFTVDALRRADKRARRRFIAALLLGFLLWLFCGIVITLIGGDGAGWWDDRDKRATHWPGSLPKIPAEYGNITQCTDFLKTLPTSAIVVSPNQGSKWMPRLGLRHVDTFTYAEEASQLTAQLEAGGDSPYAYYKSKSYFTFEAEEQDAFYLVAKGRFSVGTLRFVLEEPKSVTPQSGKPVLEVEVTARWNDKELLQTSKVCALHHKGLNGNKDGREYGVGIFSPDPEFPDQYRRLSFETVVRFPPSALSHLRSLQVDGPSFSPIEVALSPITFDNVDIKTHNGQVVVPPSYSLASKDARLRTSNGRIEGVYNTTNQLVLESTNGPIHANVNLVQLDASTIEKRNVVARTTNGGIQLAYSQHPYGVVLESLATTTNGDADIKHGVAFEGKFELSTSWGKGIVNHSPSPRDPSGQKRERTVDFTRDDHTIGVVNRAGSVYWRPQENDKIGRTVVSTSLGRASLDFS